MAKSSTAQALASLSHKFRAKIKEVGQLKALLASYDKEAAASVAESMYVKSLQATIRSLEFDNAQILKHSNKVSLAAQNNAAALGDAKASVSNWKSFSGVTFALGAGIGALSVLAYFQQIGL